MPETAQLSNALRSGLLSKFCFPIAQCIAPVSFAFLCVLITVR